MLDGIFLLHITNLELDSLEHFRRFIAIDVMTLFDSNAGRLNEGHTKQVQVTLSPHAMPRETGLIHRCRAPDEAKPNALRAYVDINTAS
jgi:hypothetical protein